MVDITTNSQKRLYTRIHSFILRKTSYLFDNDEQIYFAVVNPKDLRFVEINNAVNKVLFESNWESDAGLRISIRYLIAPVKQISQFKFTKFDPE